MHLLYLDESGQHHGCHFVLAGLAVFERKTYWLASALDQIQLKLFPGINEPIEFHASAIRVGKEWPWNTLADGERRGLLDTIYKTIAEQQLVLFASIVEREWLKKDVDEYEYGFESLVNRFDRFLVSKYKEEGDAQRGLIIIAESQYQQRIEAVAARIRQAGTRWGEAHNLSELPLFAPTKYSRLLQVADFCANAIYGKYENGYSRQFDRLAQKFFTTDGVVHGLGHYQVDPIIRTG